MEEAFLKSEYGEITGIMSTEDTETVREELIRWLLEDEVDMVVRVPIGLARKSLFKSTASVLSELEKA